MTASLLFRIAFLLRAESLWARLWEASPGAFCFGRFLPSPFSTPRGPSGPGVFYVFCIKKKKEFRFFDDFPIFSLTPIRNISYYSIANSPRGLENTTDLL